MATLNTAILAAAHADGLLPKRLTANQVQYLHPTVLTANRIYWSIAAVDLGLNLEQLQKQTEVHYNTLAQFTRFMVDRRLIYTESAGMNGQNIYFTQKRHKVAR